MKAMAYEVKVYHRRDAGHDAAARWAGLNSHVVRARNADEARRMALQHYPPEQGYVISSVAEVTLQ